MKKGIIIALAIILVIAAIVGGVYIWQKNNIDALVEYKNSESTEDLAGKQAELQQETKEIIEELGDENLQLLDEEQMNRLNEGKMTVEEAEQIIKPNKNNQNNSEKTDSTSKINDIVADIYILKAEFLGKIDGVISQGLGELSSTPAKDRTSLWKARMIKKYLSLGTSLESQCDGRINALLSELESELKKSGQSTEMVGRIRSVYNQEKSVKKAALLSQYYPK